jgi:peptide/nickel transport system substrate-binding protein
MVRHGSLKVIVIALLLAALVGGCAGAGSTAQPTPAAQPTTVVQPTQAPAQPTPVKTAVPQTLTIGQGAIPISGDPAFDTNALAMAVYRYVFDTLATSEKGKLTPSLAESWKAVDDTTWEFQLRKGVKFHNGEDFNADAVKFSIDRVLNPDNKSPWRSRIIDISEVQVVADYTVRIKTKSPIGTLVSSLLTIFIVPPKYFKEVGPDKFAAAPVGTGPFKFVSFDKLTNFTVQAADNSWRGKPTLSQVTWKKIPEDSTRIAALEAGELDAASDLPPEIVDELKSKNITVISVPIAQSNVINLRSTINSPLKDKLVRQAINYAVDKETILKTVMGGHGRVLDGQLVGPDSFGYCADLKAYPYDPSKAKELLQQAGYPNGITLSMAGSIGRYPKDKEVAQAVVGQLVDVGIKVNLEYVENVVFSQKSADGTLGPDMYIYGWQYMPALDISEPTPFFRSTETRNLLKSSEYDKLYGTMVSSLDSTAREKAACDLATWFRDYAPVLFLWQFSSINGVQPYVDGYVPKSDRTVDLLKVSIKK